MSTPTAPFGFHPGTRIPRKQPPRDEFDGKGVCKFCGQGNLTWEKHDDGWRLVELGGKRHQCPRGVR